MYGQFGKSSMPIPFVFYPCINTYDWRLFSAPVLCWAAWEGVG
jgi:hypothetical protein